MRAGCSPRCSRLRRVAGGGRDRPCGAGRAGAERHDPARVRAAGGGDRGAGGGGGGGLRRRGADRRGAGRGGLRRGLRRLDRGRGIPLRAGARRTTPASRIAFWPDTKGSTPRTLAAMIAGEDPVVDDPAAFAGVSVAARGLFALDWLLFDPGARRSRRGATAAGCSVAITARHGGDGGAAAGAVARSLGGDPDQRGRGGQPGLPRAGRVDAGALLGADRRRCRPTSTCGWGGRWAPSTGRSRGGPRPGGRGGRCAT